ncbi:hypothetical protein ACSSWA_13080 [Melioribacter sp. Ez-97]|uniref:hypothetical protein n=1 Tax=Melioribacter sp. Ez-97 TaxID=3423434 RepID=UPI003ED88DDF
MSKFILLYIGDGKSGDPKKDSDNIHKTEEIAKEFPLLDAEGVIEIAELIPMNR